MSLGPDSALEEPKWKLTDGKLWYDLWKLKKNDLELYLSCAQKTQWNKSNLILNHIHIYLLD